VIAEPPAITLEDLPKEASPEASPRTLSLSDVVGTLQILLATRRAARNAAYAHWSSLAREA
jgi:hypothetical protein